MLLFSFFFFNDTATTEIYTISLHDALPISARGRRPWAVALPVAAGLAALALWQAGSLKLGGIFLGAAVARSEEHTCELQSLAYLVCRLLLEKKKKKKVIEAQSITLLRAHTQ